MLMSWIWCTDYHEAWTDAGLADVGRLIKVPLSSGRPLGDRFPRDMTLEIISRCEPDDFIYAGPAFVVSVQLRELFDQFGVEAEYYPLAVRHKRRPSDFLFWFANLTRTVDCLDRDGSVFKPEREFATDLRRLAFLPWAEPEPPLHRVSRTLPSIIGVNDSLGAAVLAGGFTGSDWSGQQTGGIQHCRQTVDREAGPTSDRAGHWHRCCG